MAVPAAQGEARFEALLGGGPLDASALHALADQIAMLHLRAEPADPAAIVRFRELLSAQASLPTQRQLLATKEESLRTRARMGRMRVIGGESQDLLYDLARPLMELWRSGMFVEANILANRYVDVNPQGATGWALLPLYMSLRASEANDAQFAEALLSPVTPRLVAIGGLSGTGKSTLARLIGARIGRAPGARVLRSDVFRKRLAGLPPEGRLPPRHYTVRNDAQTYEAIFESADDHLACGTSVILDAVFMSRSERDVSEMLAQRRRLAFSGIWLEAPERDRIARVNARSNDASDASEKVVREQSRRSIGDVGYWHRMRVNRPLELIVAAARGVLERSSA